VAWRRENFAQPKETDCDRHDTDAVAELLEIEAVAEVAGHRIDADHAEQKPKARHQQRAHERRRRHVGEEYQSKHEQRGVFGRTEAQREGRERRRHDREHNDAEGGRDERPDGRDAERRAGPATLRHRIAVDARHHGGGLARDAHEDRCGRAAVLRAVIDAGEHDHGLGRVEAEGERQQNADAGQRTDPGENADQRANQAADERVPQDVRLQRDGEARA
jgi:hypothetical protein